VTRPGALPDAISAAHEAEKYRWITFLFLPLQYAGFSVALAYLMRPDMNVSDRIGQAVTLGFIAGRGIDTAYELGHKREPVEHWLAKVALTQSGYGHFYIEDNRCHHGRVSMPSGPASSRMGENFYQFWPRSVLASVLSA